MQYGRIAGRKATLHQLLQHMISLFEAAQRHNVYCAHEAEYYAMQVRFKSMAYSKPVFTWAGIT